MQTINDDRVFLETVLPELPDFLLSKELYWLIGARSGVSQANFPQLSLGNVRLAEARLKAGSTTATDAGLFVSIDQLYQKWRSNWARKAGLEFTNRLKLWKDRLVELLGNPSPAIYRYDVRLRVILALLEDDLLSRLPIQEQEYLSGLDARLRATSIQTDFIWDASIQAGFPADRFWYLYRAIQIKSGSQHG